MLLRQKCLHGHDLAVAEQPTEASPMFCPLCGAIVRMCQTASASELEISSDAQSNADQTDVFAPTMEIAGEDAPNTDDIETSDHIPPERASAKTSEGTGSKTNAARPALEDFTPPNVSELEIIEELGRGGMGIVYRAHDKRHGHQVALKTLQRMGPQSLVRFKQEFRALADIAHPNLASLYELHSDGSTWCLTMELLNGVEVLEYVWSEHATLQAKTNVTAEAGSERRLNADRMARLNDVLKQLAMGLNELHRAGKLHSDIKPSNVFVTTEGRLVLLDFGLISEIAEDTRKAAESIQGTPFYMSPEQVQRRPLTAASDWYSVGVMLYEVLTGQLPFDGAAVNVIMKKISQSPTPPIECRSDIPIELNDLCVGLLSTDPEKRPTAVDVLRVLGADALADQIEGTSESSQSVELVGRESHVELLNQALADVVDGGNRSVFVHGFSGMGKSALIRHFVDRVRQDERTILLEGRCYEQESVPFKALDSLVDSLAEFLRSLPKAERLVLMPKDTLPMVRLFPTFGQLDEAADEENKPSIDNADQNELRQRTLFALRQLFRNLANQRTVVLYVDDLQWGDADSSELLADLMRPPEAPPILLLGSYRREDIDTSPALLKLAESYNKGQDQPQRENVGVDPLSESDASRLASMLISSQRTDISPDDVDQLAHSIGRESGGSPFFVWELSQHVIHAQSSAGGQHESLELDEVIWSRVCQLPDDTRKLLEVFAVSGRPMVAAEVFEMTHCNNGPGLIAQLKTNGFIRTNERDDETFVETYHDRIRESVVDHLSEDQVRSHNLSIAEVLEQKCGVSAFEIAGHLRKTPDFAQPAESLDLSRRVWQRVFDLAHFFAAAGKLERSLPYALISAERAWKQNAFEVAQQHFAIASNGAVAARADDATQFRIAEGLGDVCEMRGQYVGAHEQFEAARKLTTDNIAVARVEGKRGNICYKTGEMRVACEYYHNALKALGSPVPSNIITQLFAMSKEGITQILHTFLPKQLTGKRDSTNEAGQIDLFRASLYDGMGYPYFFNRGPVPTLWTHLRHMNLAEKYPPSLELGQAYAYHAVVITAIPLAERGARYAERAYQIHSEKADRFGMGKARSFRGMSLNALGRFSEAVESGREATKLLDEAGDVWEANMARIIMSYPLYYLGELEEAYHTARTALRVGLETGDFMAIAVALNFGCPTAPMFADEGMIQSEVERTREDPLSSCAIIQARGLELLHREDRPAEAAKIMKECNNLAQRRGFRNPYIFCGYSWIAEALRIVAEREAEGPAKRKAIKKADKAANAALRITMLYKTSRVRALREKANVLTLSGKPAKALSYYDDSIKVAESQCAKFELAKSQLAKANAGLKFDWGNAEEERQSAQQTIDELTAFWSNLNND